jgi:hypothetical protein
MAKNRCREMIIARRRRLTSRSARPGAVAWFFFILRESRSRRYRLPPGNRSPALKGPLNPTYNLCLSVLQVCERRPLDESDGFSPIVAGMSHILLNNLLVYLLGPRCLASYGFVKGTTPIIEYRAKDGVAA